MVAPKIAIGKLKKQLGMVPWLRGRGPLSYHYGQWVDATYHVLVTLFGEGSEEARGFLEIVGIGAEERGWGVPISPNHPWGLHARLDRAEAYLSALVKRLEKA